MQTLAKAVSLLTSSTTPIENKGAIVPVTDPQRLPEYYVEEVDRRIPDRVVAMWEGAEPEIGGARFGAMLSRQLSDDERDQLTRRANDLRSALAPAPDSSAATIKAALSAMLGAYPQMQRHDQNSAAVIAASYAWTVRDFPHWAIIQACELVRSGKAGLSLSFCPTEPEFSSVVRQRIAWYDKRLSETQSILKAAVKPPVNAQLRPLRDAIEATLGRPLPEARSNEAKAPPLSRYDGRHAARVAADLARRKVANAARGDPVAAE